jgi:hypothetical protein
MVYKIMNYFVNKIDFDLFWSYLNNFFSLLLSLVVSLVILKYLSVNEYAIYIVFTSLFSIVNVLVSAISPNISRNVATVRISRDYSFHFDELINNLNSIIFIVTTAVSLVLVTYFFFNYNLHLFNVNSNKNVLLLSCFFSLIIYTRYSFSSSALRGLNFIKYEQQALTIAQLTKGLSSVLIIVFFKSVYFFPISILSYILILNYLSLRYLRENQIQFHIKLISNKIQLGKILYSDIIVSSFHMLTGNLGSYFFSGLLFLLLITTSSNNSGFIANYQYVVVISSLASTVFYRHQINFVQSIDYNELISKFKKLLGYVSIIFVIFSLIYFFLINYILVVIGKATFIVGKTCLLQIFLNVYLDTILIGFSLIFTSKKNYLIQYLYLISSVVFLLFAFGYNLFENSSELMKLRIIFLVIMTFVSIFHLRKLRYSMVING